MRSGIAAGNTRRSLSIKEFRGFAISDPIAPVVFINGKDWASAQIFTIAHELIPRMDRSARHLNEDIKQIAAHGSVERLQ